MFQVFSLLSCTIEFSSESTEVFSLSAQGLFLFQIFQWKPLPQYPYQRNMNKMRHTHFNWWAGLIFMSLAVIQTPLFSPPPPPPQIQPYPPNQGHRKRTPNWSYMCTSVCVNVPAQLRASTLTELCVLICSFYIQKYLSFIALSSVQALTQHTAAVKNDAFAFYYPNSVES